MREVNVDLQVNDKNRDQIALARAVWTLVKGVYGDSYVAGGAPRDWYLGERANDIDIFISRHPAVCSTALQEMIRTFYPGTEFKVLGDKKKYENSKVTEFVVQGQTFQIIEGLTYVWEWEHEISKIHIMSPVYMIARASSEFVQGFKDAQFTGEKDDPYIQKMMKRYPSIKFLSAKDTELYYHLDNTLDQEEKQKKEPVNPYMVEHRHGDFFRWVDMHRQNIRAEPAPPPPEPEEEHRQRNAPLDLF